MTSKARLGSFEELLSENNTEIKSIAWKLREIIFADYPKAIETVRLGDGAASYGLGPKKNSESHVYIMPKPEYVNLGFFHGTNLKDPAKLLEGTGQKMRHVKVRSPKDVENPVLRTLISKARAERKTVLGLK
jgi:hypothetical protein